MAMEKSLVATTELEIYDYEYPLENANAVQPGYNYGRDSVRIGLLTDIISAKATVTNFGDPTISVVCKLTDSNRKMAVNNREIRTFYAEKQPENRYNRSKFVIYDVKLDSQNATISILAEPITNYARNGIYPPMYGSAYYTSVEDLYSFPKVMTIQDEKRYPYLKFSTDRVNTAKDPLHLILEKKNRLEVMGGTEGSLLDIYGGEFFKSDGYIFNRKQIGEVDRGVVLNTNDNVTGVTIETNTVEVVNAVLHYYTYQDENNGIHYVYANVSDNGKTPALFKLIKGNEQRNGKYMLKDWTDQSEDIGKPPETGLTQVVARLISLATQWNNNNRNLGDPKITVNIDFVSLARSNELKGTPYEKVAQLGLGDGVKVYHEQLKTLIETRVSGYEFNIVSGTYDKITLGNGTKTILNRIK